MRTLFHRITFSQDVMDGQACIRGMRIPVSLVLNLVAIDMAPAEIVAEYPDLELEDIQQSLKYAAWLANERTYGFPVLSA